MSLVPAAAKKVVFEAGVSQGWASPFDDSTLVVAIDRFGESGPYQKIAEHLGITAASLEKRIRDGVGRARLAPPRAVPPEIARFGGRAYPALPSGGGPTGGGGFPSASARATDLVFTLSRASRPPRASVVCMPSEESMPFGRLPPPPPRRRP